jgi:hypothetical protein
LECGLASFDLANHKCDGAKRASGRLLQWLLIIAAALCAVVAHAEDAGEAVRTSPSFGKAGSSGTFEAICRTMESSAADNNLPIEFFTRVIWQESRFNIRARSSAGAQGIAQFMPQTAASRGLLDPFDPFQSLPESASYLRELKARFGNFGLASAAYNAGPGPGRALAFRKDPSTCGDCCLCSARHRTANLRMDLNAIGCFASRRHSQWNTVQVSCERKTRAHRRFGTKPE